MRIVVNCSGLFVILTILVLIHTAIINKSVRDIEVNYGLESAMDYALDVMGQMYRDMEIEEGKESQYITLLTNEFCTSLSYMLGTDGEIQVWIVEADIENGVFQIVVEETYQYSFRGRGGKVVCERCVVFG